MRAFESPAEVVAAVGEDLGTSEWVEITQERVDAFADATSDHQWIHVDAARAEAGPFGGTIAHGYLTLSLLPWLGSKVFSFGSDVTVLNYGTNKVRFPQPVPVGSRIRTQVSVSEAQEVKGGTQVVFRHSIQIEGLDKPGCVAETVALLVSV